ncbi:Uncharacterized [Syntrophomonas zehnderi OL-4]|uniref:Uncharacterized n=1 Tax=Syntrophomonas zehnderi OL-4 TaxID=690567 RepID=A0A0E4G9H0_9FIRM|nr:hypothetical protein [Syntrophomonas zehnderi]CFX15268.1 Uncharacterized [Syntrophomonas zehnderi OL-4]
MELSMQEVEQITDYAFAVADNPRFPKEKTKWTFLLTGSAINKNTKRRLREYENEFGLYVREDNVTVWVKDWGQIINEAYARHKYLEDSLKLAATDNSEGLGFLIEKHSQLIPNVVRKSAAARE